MPDHRIRQRRVDRGVAGRLAGSGASSGVLGLVGLTILGIGLRAWLLVSPFGYLNSDEAHTSIQAREFFRGHAWVLVPGTPYGGNLEAWLDAPFAALFGMSAMRSKIEVAALWLLAGFVLARSVRHLGRSSATAAFGVIWLLSAALVVLSTLAYPGYSVGLLAACGVVALARPLIDERRDRARTAVSPAGLSLLWLRAGATGVLAGLAVWQHPLYGWVCATTVVAVLWRQRRRVLSVIVPLVAGGLMALAPVIVTNVRHDLVSLRFRSPETVPYSARVHIWLTDLFPRAIGAKWLGRGWVTGRAGEAIAMVVFVVIVAACLAVLRWSAPSGKVAAATLLLAPFVMTLLGNTAYTLDGRYVVMILPVAALVVAHGVALLPRDWVGGLRAPLVAAGWTVLAVAVPFGRSIGPIDGVDGLNQLVAFLDARHVTAVRADYWVAYRVVVKTDERIAASPLAPVKFDRYEQRVRQAAAGGAGVLVLDRTQTADYLASRPPFDAAPWNGFPQYRSHERLNVSYWTVFLPRGTPAIGGG